MELFYSENLRYTDETLFFSKEESRHLNKVLRKKPGNLISVTNGEGLEWKGEIVSTDIRKVVAQKTESLFHQNKITPLHIAIAPTKSNDRMEWFLEKATEIGVTQITPILCQHSERKTIKPVRMKKILVGGLKQSAQFYLPKLNPLLSYEDFIGLGHKDIKLLAHCQKGNKKDLSLIENLDGNLLIVIGPEGDFSKVEIEMAREMVFTEITLGSQRLRTETAGVVACSMVATFREILKNK